jgi:hypothetical protein
MPFATLASSVWAWSSLHWVRSLQTLGCRPQRHTVKMLALALLVALWLALNWAVLSQVLGQQLVQLVAVFLAYCVN